MKEQPTKLISIQGCVEMDDNPVTSQEFIDKFDDFLRANNWYFGGGFKTEEELDAEESTQQ